MRKNLNHLKGAGLNQEPLAGNPEQKVPVTDNRKTPTCEKAGMTDRLTRRRLTE